MHAARRRAAERVSGNSMVLVITQHHRPKPRPSLAGKLMLPALTFHLDGFRLRDYPLLGRDPPDSESSSASTLPTEVGETQEREGLRFSIAALPAALGGKPPELDQSCLPCVIPNRTKPTVPGTPEGTIQQLLSSNKLLRRSITSVTCRRASNRH